MSVALPTNPSPPTPLEDRLCSTRPRTLASTLSIDDIHRHISGFLSPADTSRLARANRGTAQLNPLTRRTALMPPSASDHEKTGHLWARAHFRTPHLTSTKPSRSILFNLETSAPRNLLSFPTGDQPRPERLKPIRVISPPESDVDFPSIFEVEDPSIPVGSLRKYYIIDPLTGQIQVKYFNQIHTNQPPPKIYFFKNKDNHSEWIFITTTQVEGQRFPRTTVYRFIDNPSERLRIGENAALIHSNTLRFPSTADLTVMDVHCQPPSNGTVLPTIMLTMRLKQGPSFTITHYSYEWPYFLRISEENASGHFVQSSRKRITDTDDMLLECKNIDDDAQYHLYQRQGRFYLVLKRPDHENVTAVIPFALSIHDPSRGSLRIFSATKDWVLFSNGLIYNVATENFVRFDLKTFKDFASCLSSETHNIHSNHMILHIENRVAVVDMFTGEVVFRYDLPLLGKKRYHLMNIGVNLETKSIVFRSIFNDALQTFTFDLREASAIKMQYRRVEYIQSLEALPKKWISNLSHSYADLIRKTSDYIGTKFDEIRELHVALRLPLQALILSFIYLFLTPTIAAFSSPIAGLFSSIDVPPLIAMERFETYHFDTPEEEFGKFAGVLLRVLRGISSMRSLLDLCCFPCKDLALIGYLLGYTLIRSPFLALAIIGLFRPGTGKIYNAIGTFFDALDQRLAARTIIHCTRDATFSKSAEAVAICATRLCLHAIKAVALSLSTIYFGVNMLAYNIITFTPTATVALIGGIALFTVQLTAEVIRRGLGLQTRFL